MVLGIDFHKRYSRLVLFDERSAENEDDIVTLDALFYRDENDKSTYLEASKEDDYHLINNIYDSREDLLDYLKLITGKVCGAKKPDKIALCVYDFTLATLDMIRDCLDEMGYDDRDIIMINREEALASYIFHQSIDIRNRSCFVFDYSKEGLMVYDIEQSGESGKELFRIEEHDCTKDIPYLGDTSEATLKKLDVLLYDVALKSFDKHNVACVFLFGEGFGSDRRYDEFMSFICKKRRVFAGENLYCMGAVYFACDEKNGISQKTVSCKDKIEYDLDLDIVEWGQSSLLRVVKKGTNWYRARKKLTFFISPDTKALTLHRVKEYEKGIENIEIPVNELPIIDNMLRRINIGFDFSPSGACNVYIQDKGFGEFDRAGSMFVKVEI